MATPLAVPLFHAFNASGAPLGGGRLYTYANGTVTPAVTYQDAAGTTPNLNPVILDARGEARVFLLSDQLYTFILKDEFDVLVWSLDGVSGITSSEEFDRFTANLAGAAGAGLVGFIQEGVGAEPRSSLSKMRDFLTPEDFNASGNGEANDTDSIKLAVAACLSSKKTLFGSGTYRLTSTVDMRYVTISMPGGKFAIDHADIGLVLGNSSNNQSGPRQEIGQVLRTGGETSVPTVRVIGAKGQNIIVDRVDYLQLYADANDGAALTDSSIAYSNIWSTRCRKLELTTAPTTTGELPQWINENSFFLKRTGEILISGTYRHNHNIFHTGSLESGGIIDVQSGSSNLFLYPRFEGGASITFAADAWTNKVIPSWDSNPRKPYETNTQAGAGITVSDAGLANYVQTLDAMMQRTFDMLTVNASTCRSFSISGSDRPSLDGVVVQCGGIDRFSCAANTAIYQSPLIPVGLGDAIYFDAGEVVGFRIRYVVYNAARLRMTEANYPSIAAYVRGLPGLDWDSANSRFRNTVNQARQVGIVESPNVAYLSVQLLAGTSGVSFDRFNLQFITQSRSSFKASQVNLQRERPAVNAASPVVGYATLGEKVSNPTGGWWTATFSIDTVLTAPADAGATDLSAAVAGAAGADIVGVLLDSGETHWTTAIGTASDGTVLDIGSALPSAASIGSRLVITRWVAA